MSLESYTLAYCEIDGQLLLEHGKLTITRESRSQEVNTVAKQYAGESPGAGIINFTVEEAVPAGGLELDPGKYFTGGPVPCQIKFVTADATLTTDANIIGDSFQHGVNQEARIDFHGRAQMAPWIPLAAP